MNERKKEGRDRGDMGCNGEKGKEREGRQTYLAIGVHPPGGLSLCVHQPLAFERVEDDALAVSYL